MKLGSHFDGISAFPLAASRYGIEPVWATEIESFPIQVSRHHFPNMKHYGSITDVSGYDLEPVDIITFGSPCQDLSVAGKRKGLEGERSGLFMEAVRTIREMRCKTNGAYPTFAVWENVPGAFSSNGGADFRAALEEIAEAEIPIPTSGRWAEAGMVRGNGREIAWRVLDAQYWGVPQRRKRIFLIADFRGYRAGEILFEPEGSLGNLAESGKAREEVAASVGDGVEKSSRINCTRGGISGTVSSKWAKGTGGPAGDEHYNLIAEPINGIIPFNPGQITSPQNGNNPKPNDPCHTLCANDRVPHIAIPLCFEPRSQDGVPRIHDKGVCPTLNTMRGGNGNRA